MCPNSFVPQPQEKGEGLKLGLKGKTYILLVFVGEILNERAFYF